jgi:hypothetical protein
MGGATLGGPGRRGAAAVHNEIYGAQGESAAPGERKIIQERGRPRERDAAREWESGVPGTRRGRGSPQDTGDTAAGGSAGRERGEYHDTAARSRSQQGVLGGRGRGLGRSPEPGAGTGRAVRLRGGAGRARPLLRARAMVRLSPPCVRWGHKCDIDDTLVGVSPGWARRSRNPQVASLEGREASPRPTVRGTDGVSLGS